VEKKFRVYSVTFWTNNVINVSVDPVASSFKAEVTVGMIT